MLVCASLPLGWFLAEALAQAFLKSALADALVGRVLGLPWLFAGVLLVRSARAKATGPRRFVGRVAAVAYVAVGTALLSGPELTGPMRAHAAAWLWAMAGVLVAGCAGFVYATSPARR